jgi:hypothetical protein
VKNILILAVPRSGSSNLLHSIAAAYNFEQVFEPKPWHLHKNKWKIKDNQVAKVISFPYKIKFPNFYKEIINSYDKTILLSRYGVKEQIESLAVLKHNTIDSRNVNRKWSEDELKEVSSNEMRDVENLVMNNRKTIEEISKEFNLPINYYEDVYSQKSLIEKDIKLDLTFFEKTKKCRTPSLESKYLL